MRTFNWPTTLEEMISQRRAIPFEWGVQDCAMFAADVVEALTGDDHAARFRGKYKTEHGAYKALKKVTKVDDWRDGLLKWMEQTKLAEVEVAFAQRGDVVLVRTDRGPALAIVGSPGHTAYAAAKDGLAEFPMRFAERAWRTAAIKPPEAS